MSKPPKINRRQFIATAGAASLTLATGLPATAATKRDSAGIASGAPSYPRAILGTVDHESGIPLGGIGAGTVEVRTDGYFHDWLIFNLGAWAPDLPKEEQGPEPDMDPSAFAFYLTTKQVGADRQLRRLGTRQDQNDLYSLRWAKSVEAIEYEGVFPRATLRYLDKTLPVAISAEFYSPFIPHDSRTSGTPGFHGAFTISNHSEKPVEVSLMSSLKNPVAFGNPDRRLRSEVHADGQSAMLVMRTDCDGPRKSTVGSMSMSLKGGRPTWVLGDFEAFQSNGRWFSSRHYGTVQDNFLRQFRDKGKLGNLAGSTSPVGELRLTDAEIEALPATDKSALIKKLAQYPSLASDLDRIERVGPDEFKTEDGKARVLQELRDRLDQMAGKERNDDAWGSVALCSSITLQPGESKTIELAFGWHFPHHIGPDGKEMGHSYEHWFEDAADVNRFLIERSAEHSQKVNSFIDTVTDTTLPGELVSCWSEQLTTLNKCTWWTREGRFGVWEGLGCCGFHTMDITYQGSFSILALFPDLQLGQMKMGAEYQRSDGRVAHFFAPDLMHVDNGFDRVDMNPQFVMLACRDYLWTGDRSYLQRVFPHVVRAIASINALDSNGDGLPDEETKRNTYDQWNFFGTPSYISSLWLGALLAGERMASEMGQEDLAEKWKAIRLKGETTFEKVLWNGEYYSLWADGDNRDECCMSDQLSGVWFSHLIGLGEAVPRDRVRAALQMVVKHNFSPETGLLNATYPPGRTPRFTTDMNAQATACWTGVEYALASMLIDFGMSEEGLAIVRSIGDTYRRAGSIWDHVECGSHYYRAMCSWSTLIAASGFKVDIPRKRLSLLPLSAAIEAVKAPWVSSTGYGSFQATNRQLELSCRSGQIEFAELSLPASFSGIKASLNGAVATSQSIELEGRTVFRFEQPLRLVESAVLKISG